jgi:phosphoribosylformylglycinamidine synthase PurS subunit
MRAKVFVTLKAGVLDPQGQAVQHALGRLGFPEVSDVRIGKYVELEVGDNVDAKRIEQMCEKLLANTVIEQYRIELGGK